jgi:hypothetical protein
VGHERHVPFAACRAGRTAFRPVTEAGLSIIDADVDMFSTTERQAESRAKRPHAAAVKPETHSLVHVAHGSAMVAWLPTSPRALINRPLSAADVIQLQRSIGNRRTTECIAAARIQRAQDRRAGADAGSQTAQAEAAPSAPPASQAAPLAPPAAPPAPPAAPPARSAAPPAPSASPAASALRLAPSRATRMSPAVPSPAGGPGLARTEGKQGGDDDAQRSSGNVDLSSSDAILSSLAAASPSALGPALASAQAAKAGAQAREKTALETSFPTIQQPTGLPPGRRPAISPGKPAKGEAPSLKDGGEREPERYDTAADVILGPLPASGASVAVAEQTTEDEGNWWDWLTNRIRGFLNRIPTTDAGLSTSAGERPRVDLSGAADPSRMGQHEQESAATVAKKQGEADQATTADFGENSIAPDVGRQTLRSKYHPAASKGAAERDRHAAASNAFDHFVGPSVGQQIAAENQKYGEARSQHWADSAELRAESNRRIAEEDSRTRSEQLAMRQQAREQVDAARQEWRAANARAAQSFSDGAEAKRKEADKQINTKVADTERQADAELTKAETESNKEKAEAEKKAAEEKRKAEEQPRSWWQRFKGAVSSAFNAIRDAVNGIFEAVRAKVRQLIQAAKRLVRGLIEVARTAIVGLIRTFGEALKGLVSIALAAFPEAAERARKWIDSKVEAAVDGVNRAAEALKKAADAALDWLGEQLDKLLAKLQAVFDSILAVVATIVDLLLNLDEIWARIVAKVREAAPVPSDVAGVLKFFEDLRDFIQAPAAAAPSPTAAASNKVEEPGMCPECEKNEALQPGASSSPQASSRAGGQESGDARAATASDADLPRLLSASPDASSVQRKLEPPGNCIQGIHDQMQRLVKAWCDHPSGRTCVPLESCSRIQQKIRRNQLCAQYRRAINDQCYEGGDLGHRIAEQDARRAQANCMALYRAQCEKRVPPPVPVPKEETEKVWERFKRFMRDYQRELALGVVIACVITIVALLVPEPVVTKIVAALSALTAVVGFIALWVKFKNWDRGGIGDNQA